MKIKFAPFKVLKFLGALNGQRVFNLFYAKHI